MSCAYPPLTSRPSGYARPVPGSAPPPPTPPAPGDGSSSGDLIDLLDAQCVEYWLCNEIDGVTITGQKGVADATIESGQALRNQPAVFTGDPANCTATNGVGALRAVVAAADVPAHQGILVVYVQRVQSTRLWQNLAVRDDGYTVIGGWGLSITQLGAPRGYIRRPEGANILLGSEAAASFGSVEAIGMSCGAAGQKLWWGGSVVAAAPSITDTIGGSSDLVLWQSWDGSSPVNGAIALVALFATQAAADTNIPLIVAEIKATLTHANEDAAGGVTAGSQTTMPVLANDFWTGSPTLSITRQPALATAAIVGSDIVITAGGAPGADSLDYTVNGSAAGRVSFTVEAIPGANDKDTIDYLFRYPFNNLSPNHRGIEANSGSITYTPVSSLIAHGLAGNAAMNDSNNFGVPVALGRASDPLVTIAWNGSPLGNSVMFSVLPQLRLPGGWPHYPNGGGEACVLVQEDGLCYELYNFNRTALTASLVRVYDIRGTGYSTTINQVLGASASGVASLLGTVRVTPLMDEEDPGTLFHLVVPRGMPNHSTPDVLDKRVWPPAVRGDFDSGQTNRNNGDTPYGGVLAFKPDFDFESLIDAEPISAKSKRVMTIMGRTYRDRGLMVIDGGNVPHHRFDKPVPDATVRSDMLVIQRKPWWWGSLHLVTPTVSGDNNATMASNNLAAGTLGTMVFPTLRRLASLAYDA